jgi:hypothetical protein
LGAVLVHGDGQDDAAALLELAIRVGRLDGQGAAGVGGVRLEEELEAVSSFDVLGERRRERERERRLLLSWAKAGNDSKGRNKATRSEGDDLGDSAARALMRHGGRGRGVRG